MYRRCIWAWRSYFVGKRMQILVGELGQECIDMGRRTFLLGGQEFTCHLLEQINLSAVTGCIFYLFHAPELDSGGWDSLERFYIESWQIALLDAARLWLERYLRRQQPEGSFLSGSFGPGFYGMEVEAVGAMVEALGGEAVGISLLPDGMMKPAKSLVGMFLTGLEPFDVLSGDCFSCQGFENCQMCRHYMGRE